MRAFLLLLLLAGCSSAGGVDPEFKASGGASASGGGSGQGSSGTSGQTGGNAGDGQGGGGDAGGASGAAGQGGSAEGGATQGGSGGAGSVGGSGGSGTSGQGGSSGASGQGGGSGGTGAGQGGSGAAGAGGDPFGGGGAEAGGAGGGAVDGQCDEALLGPAEVYAHSADTLYRVNAETKEVTKVGDFTCSGSVIDIALDKSGNLYGTTFNALVSIDKNTAACKTIKSGSYPNSLSFVPEGTIFPDKEALVGYFGSTYAVIDTVTGSVTNKGAITGGYSSSGDIVSVIGGGTYLTVNGNGCGDCIVQVNPVTGDLIENLGPIGYSAVYGLAFWGGELYGFNSAGKLFLFDLATKKSTAVAIPNAPSLLSFYGAGSTTCARLGKP